MSDDFINTLAALMVIGFSSFFGWVVGDMAFGAIVASGFVWLRVIQGQNF